MKAAGLAGLVTVLGLGGSTLAQPLSIAFRNTVNLGSSATDQNGQTFTVAGMSGIARRSGDEYWAVMDNSNKLVKLSIQVGPTGTITSAAIQGGLTLDTTSDFEGIAFDVAPGSPDVWLSEETAPAVHRFNFATGVHLATYAAPPVFSAMRANFGFESLTKRSDAPGFWTANEEALTVDGPVSSQAKGTTVRLVRYDASGGTFVPGPQFAYLTQSWHGSNITSARSGVSDLLTLPDGRLLLLERSFAFNLMDGLFQTRIYELSFAGAIDVSSLPGLIGQTYAVVTKTLLYQGDQQNLEGLALGPSLGAGKYSLIGIVDDGDPISVNRVVGFELSGVGAPPCYPNCDGVGGLTGNDFQCFLNAYVSHASYADCDGVGGLTGNDFQCFLDKFVAGCL